MTGRTKIVATVGPASESVEVLTALVAAGVDVFRLGLAHDPPEVNVARVERIRGVAADAGRPIAVLADLPGPKIRSGDFGDGVFLPEGHRIVLESGSGPCDDECMRIDYDHLISAVALGDRLTIGDGAVALEVVAVEPAAVVAEVVAGGRVQGRPGVSLPSHRLQVEVPTIQDRALLEVIAPHVDFVAASFVRSADEIRAVRAAVGRDGPAVVAKIETRAAVDALDDIIRVSDAVMVARGDLGNECPIEDVPHLQKRIIRSCVAFGVPVITATQMLESMIHAPTPTRAEATDIANAVFDGTDALMLSGETAIGHDPVLVVRTMARIAERAEREANYIGWGERLGKLQADAGVDDSVAITAAMSHAAWRAAVEIDLDAILCCTRSGLSARAMARFRTPCPLVGASPRPSTLRRLSLSFGVTPLEVGEYQTTDEMVWCVVEAAVRAGIVSVGDQVAVLAGAPEDPTSTTDVLRVVRVR